MIIRNIETEDLNRAQEIYDCARLFMRNHDNKNQWNSSYPGRDIIEKDIENKTGYIISENNITVGVFALLFGEDPTYKIIEEGSWLNDKPYATIHRIASDGTCRGILKTAVEYALAFEENIRIDTHHDNYVMQNALTKLGFKRCGIIYLENGDPRIAFQLLKENYNG